MILTEDGNSGSDSGLGFLPDGEFAGGYDFDGGDDLKMDLDELFNLLSEPDDLSQSSHPKVPEVESATGAGNQKNCGSSILTFNDVTLEPSCSGSFKEWILPVGRDQDEKRVGVSQSEIPSCSTASSFFDGESNCVSDGKEKISLAHNKVALSNLNFNIPFGETEAQFRHAGGKDDYKDASHGLYVDSLGANFGHYYTLTPNNVKTSESENDFQRSTDPPCEETYVSLHNVAAAEPTFSHYLDHNPESGAHHSDVKFGINFDNAYVVNSPPYWGGGFIFDLQSSNELQEFQIESACSAPDISMINYYDDKRLNFTNEGINKTCPISTNLLSSANDKPIDEKLLGMPLSCIQSAAGKKHLAVMGDEKGAEVVASKSMVHNSVEIHGSAERKVSCSDEISHLSGQELKQTFSGVSSSMLNQKNFVSVKDGKGDMNSSFMRSQVNGISVNSPFDGASLSSDSSEHYLLCVEKLKVNKQPSHVKQVRDSKLIRPKCLGNLSSVSHESIQSNLPGSNSHVDNDSEICILEDISQPAVSRQSFASGNGNAPLRHSAFGECINYRRVGSARPKTNDERFIFQAALQDLSQPRSEASPPEGVLAVPLLRHQRIALSWMVQKETSSLYCSGGILADDQGLGKTVSTIALILKERAPSVKTDLQIIKKEEFETLNLDEDDEEVTEVGKMKQQAGSCKVMLDQGPKKGTGTFEQSKGRPAAGTLIVCPTSVLRQWAEELFKKVTDNANLSVLIYHGSNRTKDPCELAKYDVVITTYSIVSMEVPKQPLANEDEFEKGKVEGENVASLGFSSGKKRKYPPSSSKKDSKNKKEMDATLLESVARPLAKVAWFRVVLDEAQSIKNHRTQVARACWGLRAKRRWCLSGTPIQNAIDDLYSYFRFLRYDPYAVYSSFCSKLKIPIQKSPKEGYKKLQAVLKAIMLRRTKGTHIDGKPIINLPPKVVELKKVDFTSEERKFYSKLESKSRAQFREYAAAGTVKQNYVNILLMLLRLRQACDHPLLVRDADSNYLGRSSVEMAKKLPREKQICLLNCLEASLAICGICNDAPEDAVVSICGHVFCNQCICEHLTGDDNQCPTPKCKFRLDTSSVFSRATLNSSLSDQATQDGSSELVGANSSCSDGLPHDSSKIRAALEVLKSLNRPQDYRSTHGSLGENFDGNVTIPDNLCSAGNSVYNESDKKNIPSDENVNGSVVIGEKAIVFSQWTRMLDLLEARLKSCSIQYRRLDGTMPVVARDKAVKDFNTLPEVSVMIMSLKAASLGLNMVAACRVLLLDLWWNPTTEDQAIDRAHRIGQTRPVNVLRLTVKDTVEDRILALQQKKRKMVASAFGEDGSGGHQTRLTVEDLKDLFMV